MKLKKSLLALSTAAAVTVAGVPAAFAEECQDNPPAVQNTDEGDKDKGDDKSDDAPADETNKNDEKEEGEGKAKPELSSADNTGKVDAESIKGSFNNFFDWDVETDGLKKIKDVGALLGAIVAIISGITGLATAVQKLVNFRQ